MDKIIFHVDVNSAFLSWTAVDMIKEAKKQGNSAIDIREIPSIIGGDISTRHGIVVAKSIPAKKYGIETAEPVVSAQKKCPSLAIYPPNHQLYKAQSNQLMNYLKSICPILEQLSIDECFLDMTNQIAPSTTPEAVAESICSGIKDSFGFTVNIGISNCKVLAKMASDFEKPNKVHTLFPNEIQKKMWPLPVSDLYMCGKSSANILHKLGIITIGDLAKASPDIIESHLKSHGLLLHDFANGIDFSPVSTQREALKGIGNSITLSQDITDREEAKKILWRLAETVAKRIQKENKTADLVTVEIKYATFQSVSHQAKANQVSSQEDIYQFACSLFDEIWDSMPIRLLGIRTSKLSEKGEPIQMSLFDYQEEEQKEEKKIRLESALTNLRDKYGSAIIRKAKDL